MTRLPFPEEVAIADVIAFDTWSPEQRRIAVAGVAVHYDVQRDSEAEDARLAGFDEGRASAELMLDVVGRATMQDFLDRLQLFRQSIATYDTRYTKLGEIIGDLTKKLTVPA